jgi:DNA repair protein RecO (recombination protein O)
MAFQKDEAFVLFKRSFGESDKIIRLFTRTSGKITLIAKGANKSQKRFMNALEPFNYLNVEYFEKPGGGMARLENADIKETHEGIEKSFRKTCIASFFTELVDKLTKEREPHEMLFLAVRDILGAVKDREFAYSDVLHHQFHILNLMGFMPNLDSCVYCGTAVPEDQNIYFSKQRGGILCHRCARSIPGSKYGQFVIPNLVLIRNHEGNSLAAGFINQAQEIMEGFMSFHLDVEFKSYKIMKKAML